MSGDVHSEKPHHNEPHENPSPGYFNDTPTTTTDLNGIFSHEQSRHHEYSDKPAKLSPLHAFKHPFVCARSFSRRISAFLPEMTVDPAPSGSGLVIDSEAPPKKRKLTGREFWESIGSPKTIVAPMVEQSEYAWRLLSRRHSPPGTLCYTPMFHSRLFATTPTYRAQSFQAPDLDGHPSHDRPTFVQFCSNAPSDLLFAAKFVSPHCDAVDLNLGCPQGIARKGHYGAFLQEEWSLIHDLISTLNKELDIPVTAKIRILETKERSLEYAKMVVDAGASVLTVHGRTREQKGHNTGMADWDIIRYIRENLPPSIVVLANGNILWQEDVERCIKATGVDGVMSAEGNLHNPAVFQTDKDWDKRFPRMDVLGREYLGIIREYALPHLHLEELWVQPQSKRTKKQFEVLLADPNVTPIKSHLFKLWHSLLPRHTHVRDLLARAGARAGEDVLESFEMCLREIERVIEQELEKNPEAVGQDGRWVGPDTLVEDGEKERGGIIVELENGDGTYRRVRRVVPWYRCQPYYRPLPDEAIKKGALTAPKKKTEGREERDERPGGEKKVKVGPEARVAKEVVDTVGVPCGEEVCR